MSDFYFESKHDAIIAFHRRLITHTSKLMEEKQENLCIKILQTLREMMSVDPEYGEKVYIRCTLIKNNDKIMRLYKYRETRCATICW